MNYSENFGDVLNRAIDLASRTGGLVCTEHLLYGLAAQTGCVAQRVLGAAHISGDDVLQLFTPRNRLTRVTMSTRAARAVSEAEDIARRAGSTMMNTEHLLLAVISDRESVAAQVLEKRWHVDLAAMAEVLTDEINAAARRAANSRGTMTMDDVVAYEMDAAAITSAMTSGSLDACANWSPATFTILDAMGDDAFVLADNVTFSDRSASVASWIVMNDWAEENHDLLVRFTRALYKGMDYRAANIEETAQWVANQLGASYDTIYAQRGDAEWLTSAQLIEQINDGTIENLYEVQKQSFGDSVDQSTPVSDYVLFDVMLEAAQ